MIALLAIGSAWAAPIGPIEEVEHPRYVDIAGTDIAWSEIEALARGTEAARKVRRRRLGRTLLRFTFAGATALEAWGTYELARRDNHLWLPLAGQASLTGACAVLLWTSMPADRASDRALLLNGVNNRLRSAP